MKQYLYTALICFAVAIIGLLLMSCVHYKPEPKTWQSSCGPNSILAISTVGKTYPTRIAIGFSSEENKKKGLAHAQSQIYIDGEWKWLQVWSWPEVVIGNPEFEMIDIEYLSGEDTMLKEAKQMKPKERN